MKKQAITVTLDIEKLPEGWYVATSPDVQGLVAQEKTFEKVVETARELTVVLLQLEQKDRKHKLRTKERIFYPVEVAV